jgi:hypothetical protein
MLFARAELDRDACRDYSHPLKVLMRRCLKIMSTPVGSVREGHFGGMVRAVMRTSGKQGSWQLAAGSTVMTVPCSTVPTQPGPHVGRPYSPIRQASRDDRMKAVPAARAPTGFVAITLSGPDD